MLFVSTILGAVNLYSREPGFFTPERKQLLKIYIAHAAAVIKLRLYIDELEIKVRDRTSELKEQIAEYEKRLGITDKKN